MASSEGMIGKWPKAAKTIINHLSAEEKEEAQAMAEKWDNEAAPPEVQAQVTETKGANMIEHFAMEMFKKASMRVFVLSAWKNRKGKLMLGGHDFNDQFANGKSFMKTRKFKEPSKMDKADATTLLEFWFTCQENNIQPPFAFKAWQDSDGEIHEAAVHPSLEHQRYCGSGKLMPKDIANRHHSVSLNDPGRNSDTGAGSDELSSSNGEGALSISERESISPPRPTRPLKDLQLS
ncbi:hypothetical protein DFJ58DRAFT_735753 [Suillus subalutaceus]|uniref:uncharacterized protein n=1 Tax=Suillus subalutaceus TaxID=48586 RepID=UPI001B863CC5|nr:uncharacterized protein DFJ58DRAFT_735753 [Suillus subalutaceus]KAG1834665.1 hypothetical protein DFJ58DRAFT_735753 [Suillus subalutaceus]